MFGLTVPWAQELELSNNLVVVLFCISLITGDAEHLFMPVDYLLVFFLKIVYLDLLSILKPNFLHQVSECLIYFKCLSRRNESKNKLEKKNNKI